jgi:hypothetical protein
MRVPLTYANSTVSGVHVSVPVLVTDQPAEKNSLGLNCGKYLRDCETTLQSSSGCTVGAIVGEGVRVGVGLGPGVSDGSGVIVGRGLGVDVGYGTGVDVSDAVADGLGRGVRVGSGMSVESPQQVGSKSPRESSISAFFIAVRGFYLHAADEKGNAASRP